MKWFKRDEKEYPKQFSKVTVVDNETGEETTGTILIYTPRLIHLRDIEFSMNGRKKIITEVTFDAKKVHFKRDSND